MKEINRMGFMLINLIINSLGVSLEKYIKIIIKPLIIIRNIMIEYIKFDFQIDKLMKIKILRKIIIIIKLIGWIRELI